MSLSLVFRNAAQAEFDGAALWYEARSPARIPRFRRMGFAIAGADRAGLRTELGSRIQAPGPAKPLRGGTIGQGSGRASDLDLALAQGFINRSPSQRTFAHSQAAGVLLQYRSGTATILLHPLVRTFDWSLPGLRLREE